jgi:hypothetical protein
MRRTMRVRWGQIQKAREQAKGGREILNPFVFWSHKGGSCITSPKPGIHPWLPPGSKIFGSMTSGRHTFASRLAMAGVDLYTVQRAGGWKTAIMVQRYAHLSPDHLRAAVERLTTADQRAIIQEPSGGPAWIEAAR